MKRVCRSLVYFATAVLPLVVPAMASTHQMQPFALTLEVPKQPLRADKPIVLRVKVTNTSDHGVSVPVSLGSPDSGKVYLIHVLNEQGHPAPPWVPPPPPEDKTVLRAGSIHGIGLQPGESLTDEVNISHVYDLSLPGRYKVWVAEPFYRGAHLPNGIVKSNTVIITVK